MMLILAWLSSLAGFVVLCLGMARHRKTLRLSVLTSKQENVRLYLGLALLLVSLSFTLNQSEVGDGIALWCGLLTITSFKVVMYLNYRYNRR